MLLSAVSCSFFFKRFEGKMGNNDEEAGESWRKLRKTGKNWGACWEQLRGGTRGSALRTAAGRDMMECAGVRCGPGHGGSRCGDS